MSEWWNSMTLLQQIFSCIAIPATVILLLQTVLMLFGLGDGHADGDAGHGFDAHHSDMSHLDSSHGHSADGLHGNEYHAGHGNADAAELNLFTIKGILTFFAVGGWLGVALLGSGMTTALAVTIAFIAGAGALVLVGVMLKYAMKLQDNGNMDLKNAIGRMGKVYITIPGTLSGEGKVNIMVQEQLMELSAMTHETQSIKAGTLVEVLKLMDNDVLLVQTVNEKL